MSKVTIYHNPKCMKSRQTPELLRERGFEPTIVEHLRTPPDVATIGRLVKQLSIESAELIRTKEYREIGLPATDDAGFAAVRDFRLTDVQGRVVREIFA